MQKKLDIARALKDKNYFDSLTEEEKAQVRAVSPVGEVDLSDDELFSVSGGLEGGIRTESTGSGSGSGAALEDGGGETCHCHCHCTKGD